MASSIRWVAKYLYNPVPRVDRHGRRSGGGSLRVTGVAGARQREF